MRDRIRNMAGSHREYLQNAGFKGRVFLDAVVWSLNILNIEYLEDFFTNVCRNPVTMQSSET